MATFELHASDAERMQELDRRGSTRSVGRLFQYVVCEHAMQSQELTSQQRYSTIPLTVLLGFCR